MIDPRGGTVWPGSLFTLLEPLCIDERLVRTLVFRQAKEDWLTALKIARRSHCSRSR